MDVHMSSKVTSIQSSGSQPLNECQRNVTYVLAMKSQENEEFLAVERQAVQEAVRLPGGTISGAKQHSQPAEQGQPLLAVNVAQDEISHNSGVY
ncbi:hypothetical protein STEG23_036428 [Scotinomys teguina]